MTGTKHHSLCYRRGPHLASTVFLLLDAFPPAEDKSDEKVPLSIPSTNWQSAESDFPTSRELVSQQLDTGWLFQYPGSLEDAQQEFGDNLAISKLGLAWVDNRPP